MHRTIAVPALMALLLPAAVRAQAPATGDLQPLPIQLPKPMFEGTPQNLKVPNLQKPLGRPRDPFLAPAGVTNVAKGKKVTLPRLPESDEVVETLQEAAGKAREIGEDVGQRASRLFEKGSEKVLDRFGVPSKNDIQTLLKQVQQLTAKVERMNGGRATTRRARA